MANIMEEYGLRQVQHHPVAGLSKALPDGVAVTSTEIIGIEVEVENAADRVGQGLNRVWQQITDGSLRNNGIELVSRPIQATAAPAALEHLLKSYLTENCCFSPRTSVHVHLNVQDLTRTQAVDFILIYAIYEKLFYKFTGRGRQKNIYCVPLSDCDLLVYLADNGETRNDGWSKYTGLNTLPIRTQGTIEFRHMHGTFDVAKLSMWINLICKLKEYIKRATTKQIRQAIAEMNDGYDFEGLMNEVFGEYAAAFKYEGPLELNYLQAKQAIGAKTNTRTFVNGGTNAAAFYNFKG